MSRPTARVLALLEILQGGGTRTVTELADRLQVDERTVRRYVAHLDELGIPIASVRGRYGGYRLARGYRMPPLMLSAEEGSAVLLGLVAARRAGLVTTTAAAVEAAMAKLLRVLPDAVRDRLGTLLALVQFTGPQRPPVATGSEILLTLAEAVRDARPASIGYTDGRGRDSDRTLEPYGIVAHQGRWYVVGRDSLSGELRTFRADRIGAARLRPGTFPRPDDFDAPAAVLRSLASAPYAHQVAIAVQAPAEAISAVFPAAIATLEEIPADGWIRVRLRAERLDWIPGLLATLDRPFVIEEPAALRELVRELAARLRAGAEAAPNDSGPEDTVEPKAP